MLTEHNESAEMTPTSHQNNAKSLKHSSKKNAEAVRPPIKLTISRRSTLSNDVAAKKVIQTYSAQVQQISDEADGDCFTTSGTHSNTLLTRNTESDIGAKDVSSLITSPDSMADINHVDGRIVS